MKKIKIKGLKKIKKVGSKMLIGFTWYFFYGFFNSTQSKSTDLNLIK